MSAHRAEARGVAPMIGRRRFRRRAPLPGVVVVAVLLVAPLLAGCARADERSEGASAAGEQPTAGTAGVPAGAVIDASPADWEIALEKIHWAKEQQLDQLPIGEVIAMLGSTFVGTAYVPQVLEAPGPERLIVNLRQLDCVTFVEHVLVLSRLVLTLPDPVLHDGDRFRAHYADALTRVRYRDGVLNGYPDRLHYFSEWISDGARKGLLRPVTEELGGVPLVGDIDFMSTHPDAYRQLSDPSTLRAIRDVEARLNTEERSYIPQERIGDAADGIRNGDIIAATSTVAGLDIAHTGIAIWQEGRLHLLHAPLVGSAVEISERPLAERIELIRGQDGIMVARPLPPEDPDVTATAPPAGAALTDGAGGVSPGRAAGGR